MVSNWMEFSINKAHNGFIIKDEREQWEYYIAQNKDEVVKRITKLIMEREFNE